MTDSPKDIIVNKEYKNWSEYPEYQELFWELTAPLEEVFADEFQRYLDLFFTFWKKTPFHVRTEYGSGFLRQKGKKKNGEEYERGCYPALIAKMLDHERWQGLNPDKRHTEAYWIALYPGIKSSWKIIDIDNKENIFGYYRPDASNIQPKRPIVTLTLEHLQNIKRIYDTFPGHVWCVSSGTLGLHAWERLPSPRPIGDIQAVNKCKLKRIGLGSVEVHPMSGRPFRRPFGQDYYTITDNGIVREWWRQLEIFENENQAPSFEAIYQALRSLLTDEFRYRGISRIDLYTFDKPHLQKYITSRYDIDMNLVKGDLIILDDWAEEGFPMNNPVTLPVGNIDNQRSSAVNKPTSKQIIRFGQDNTDNVSSCDIDLSVVCDGQWVQHLEKWAIDGLPCHDSLFIVCSQLARWLYYVELHYLPIDERIERINKALITYCRNKNNGFISRLNSGLVKEVEDHISRSISSSLDNSEDSLLFTRIRQKREKGKYRRIINLEDYLLDGSSGNGQQGTEEGRERDNSLSSRCASLCCTHFDIPEDKEIEESPIQSEQSNSNDGFIICDIFDGEEWKIPISPTPIPIGPTAEDRRSNAESWKYHPDNTPLPEKLLTIIENYYKDKKKRLTKPTLEKITRFINHLRACGGSGHLSIASLKKMGFSNDRARDHLKRLEDARVIWRGGYCPAAGIGRRFALTKKTMEMMPSVESGEKLA